MRKRFILYRSILLIILLISMPVVYAEGIDWSNFPTYNSQQYENTGKSIETQGDVANLYLSVVYVVSTICILLVSCIQISKLQKQHKQNMGFLMFSKRTEAYNSVWMKTFENIDLGAVIFLFNYDIYINVQELYNMKFKLNYETTILGGLVGTLSQTNEDLCYKYNYLYNKVNSYNAIPENIDIELFYHTLDEVICFFQYNDYIAQDLRSRAKTMIDLNQKINELALRTELSMRAYIKESIE